jgi:predicted nuclease of predicted toxin-antitoxin system
LDQIRFHLDEHIHSGVARGLRLRGVDLTTTAEAGLLSAPDDEQLAYCLAENRVVVTNDLDYLQLHAAGTEHAGICYCHQDKYSIGQLIAILLLVRDCYSPDEMLRRVEFL